MALPFHPTAHTSSSPEAPDADKVPWDLYSHVLPGMQEDAASRIDAALKRALGEGDAEGGSG